MDLNEYRDRPEEQKRYQSIISILPETGGTLLEIGARDCYITKKLANRFKTIYALDLEEPEIRQKGIIPVKGDVTNLEFPDNHFDTVLCAEVLEHIPPEMLQKACDEIVRVAKDRILIGVPFNQDIRMDRTTCSHCGKKNPPFGHVNSFTRESLAAFFRNAEVESVHDVGETKNLRTNPLSVFLMDLAGNPWGPYDQEENCIHCDHEILAPKKERGVLSKVCSSVALRLKNLQNYSAKTKPHWIHMLLRKTAS